MYRKPEGPAPSTLFVLAPHPFALFPSGYLGKSIGKAKGCYVAEIETHDQHVLSIYGFF
jgi:hypothetical protein